MRRRYRHIISDLAISRSAQPILQNSFDSAEAASPLSIHESRRTPAARA